MEVPWEIEALVEFLPQWLDAVTSECMFTWVIDGIDQLLGPSPIEGRDTQSDSSDEAFTGIFVSIYSTCARRYPLFYPTIVTSNP